MYIYGRDREKRAAMGWGWGGNIVLVATGVQGIRDVVEQPMGVITLGSVCQASLAGGMFRVTI